MSADDKIRTQVSKTYTNLVEAGAGSCCAPDAAPQVSSCCAPAPRGAVATSSCCAPEPAMITSCCTPPPAAQQKGLTAQVAGYDAIELGQLPADAVVNSFGCGNPLAFSGVEIGQTVLDLGAGAGIDVILAAQKVGPTGRVIGVDMTDAMIARATENIRAAGITNAEVKKGIIEELPVADGSVDWVISNCVINLSPDKPRVFAEIARVLAPGGRISISDIVVQGLPQWARDSQALYGACVAGAISEEAYLQGLREAGLVDVEVSERLVYDKSQVEGFLGSEEAVAELGRLSAEQRAELVSAVTGKIWSAKFVGSKGARGE